MTNLGDAYNGFAESSLDEKFFQLLSPLSSLLSLSG
jgi:hypothetical protein